MTRMLRKDLVDEALEAYHRERGREPAEILFTRAQFELMGCPVEYRGISVRVW